MTIATAASFAPKSVSDGRRLVCRAAAARYADSACASLAGLCDARRRRVDTRARRFWRPSYTWDVYVVSTGLAILPEFSLGTVERITLRLGQIIGNECPNVYIHV